MLVLLTREDELTENRASIAPTLVDKAKKKILRVLVDGFWNGES